MCDPSPINVGRNSIWTTTGTRRSLVAIKAEYGGVLRAVTDLLQIRLDHTSDGINTQRNLGRA
ncbi:hypothetical protein FRB95_012532 [Tulasnella sp. JGI-2019a]|nr:hypothetical protein FRB93_001587 [Tulasnella sp. JGI-2019a]KAG9034839.1 hypothetical protein FRB95_012532 [Tulasnella sp. JGI-2019a]